MVFNTRFVPHFVLEDDELVLYNEPSFGQKFKNFLRDHSTLFFVVSHRLEFTRSMLVTRREVPEEEKIQTTWRILEQIQRTVDEIGIPLYVFYIRDDLLPAGNYEQLLTLAGQRGIDLHVVPLLDGQKVGDGRHWNGEGHLETMERVAEVLKRDPLFSSPAATETPASQAP
jgi:hypothetical protein